MTNQTIKTQWVKYLCRGLNKPSLAQLESQTVCVHPVEISDSFQICLLALLHAQMLKFVLEGKSTNPYNFILRV